MTGVRQDASQENSEPEMPDIPARPSTITHDEYECLVKAAQTEAIIKVAVVHPCDDVSLGDALEAAQLRLIEQIFVRKVQ